jgi:serine-protein kinase ATM
MTADMVNGMGTTGTQGVFQRCAEETLRVLRNDSEVVLTVLEVFKYDPLHSWCVNRCPLSCLAMLCSATPISFL